jgi:hypothetical protein
MSDYDAIQAAWTDEAKRVMQLAATVIPRYIEGRFCGDHWDLPHTDEIVAELVRQIERRDPEVRWPGHKPS